MDAPWLAHAERCRGRKVHSRLQRGAGAGGAVCVHRPRARAGGREHRAPEPLRTRRCSSRHTQTRLLPPRRRRVWVPSPWLPLGLWLRVLPRVLVGSSPCTCLPTCGVRPVRAAREGVCAERGAGTQRASTEPARDTWFQGPLCPAVSVPETCSQCRVWAHNHPEHTCNTHAPTLLSTATEAHACVCTRTRTSTHTHTCTHARRSDYVQLHDQTLSCSKTRPNDSAAEHRHRGA